jgi:hypothetical protein
MKNRIRMLLIVAGILVVLAGIIIAMRMREDPAVPVYTIFFMAGDGTGTPPDTMTGEYGLEGVIPGSGGLVAPAGMEFVRWVEEGGNRVFEKGRVLQFTENLVLVAEYWPKKIERLRFEESEVFFDIEELVTVRLIREPPIGRGDIRYYTEGDGVIQIVEYSNDGCVIGGKAKGDAVLFAEYEGIVASVPVIVTDEHNEPYIIVPQRMILLIPGAEEVALVRLWNGSAADLANFRWGLGRDNKTITIKPSRNVVTITAHKFGTQLITVGHPLAKNGAEITVRVVPMEELPVYIKVDKTELETGIVTEEDYPVIRVELMGVEYDSGVDFKFTIEQGEDLCSIVGMKNSITVVPKDRGEVLFEVTHPRAVYPRKIKVTIY